MARKSLVIVDAATLAAACGEMAAAPAELNQNHARQDAIIDGQQSTETDYPSTGVILFTVNYFGYKFGSMLCTGTLIAPDVVLAAGHCDASLFLGSNDNVEYFFSLALDVSEFGKSSDLALPPRTSRVKSVLANPEFDMENFNIGLAKNNDISLFFLAEAFEDVDPAVLVVADRRDDLKVGAKVFIAGYGQRDPEPYSQTVGVKYHADSVINEIAEFEMQIGKASPVPQKCHGDSGGPTFMDFDDGVQRLIGVTSHAYDESDCGKGGVDTRVDPYLDWITTELENACTNGVRVACDAEDRAPDVEEL